MRHAIAEVSGYRIPLIGIPEDATLEECDLCHDYFGLRSIRYNGVQFLCLRCGSDVNTVADEHKTYDMNTIPRFKRLASTILLACSLLAFPVATVTFTSCTTSQQRITYNSLYSVGLAVNSAYAAYMDRVVDGTSTFNSSVGKAYNDFQVGFNVAVVAAQNDPKAIAPQNVIDLANAVYAAIKQYTK